MRLITRSDFDGLVCAMILKECNLIDEILFVHPKEVQDGNIKITSNDILTNLPYDERCGVCFDHHESELKRQVDKRTNINWVIDASARSAARVVYNFYKQKGLDLSRIPYEIMTAVDKCDSADFSINDILEPKGWVLLSFIMDARSGFGRFHNFTISNYQLMMDLIDYCLKYNINEILELPDVKERVDLYFEEQEKFKNQLKEIVKIKGKVALLDLRDQKIIHAGNRFMIYALYPDIEMSIHIAKGFSGRIALMIGKNVLNRSEFDVGRLCLRYGGGGHFNAGTCQIEEYLSDLTIEEIVGEINN